MIAHNSVLYVRTKHIEVEKHFIKEKMDPCAVCIPYLLMTKQIADVLIKGLLEKQFDKLIDKLAMKEILNQLEGSISCQYLELFFELETIFLLI